MREMIVSLLPVFMILGIGVLIRKKRIVDANVIDGLKNIILKFALPFVLFTTFAKADLANSNALLLLSIFVLCVLLFLLGMGLHRFLPSIFPEAYTDGFFTGFEFGMIGVGLFTAIWGIEKLPIIAMLALGHEIFIWGVFVPLLDARKKGKVDFVKIAKDLARSPIIIGIILGIVVNLLGIYDPIGATTIGASMYQAFSLLGNLISPSILIIIGYQMTFQKVPIRKSIALLIGRWIAVLAIGSGVYAILAHYTQLDPFFKTAFFAFLLLPPPYVLPIFMKADDKESVRFFSELLIYYTVLSFVGYIILMSIF